MKVISWNLLRLTGAGVADVAALLERERPDVLLMQEVTQHLDVLPGLAGGHYNRLPWPGRVHGLAIWSRYNFATPQILPLPASALPGRWPRRRSQITQVADITFANVHLSHGQLLNRRQLLRIAAALKGRPSVIIGDYNAVDIVVPEHSNHKVLDWARRIPLRLLLEAGCRIWLRPGEFDHSKLMTIDDAWSMIGSANWDTRSFRLNFELNVEIEGPPFAQMINDMTHTGQSLTLSDLDADSLPIRLRNAAARLLQPYL
jgi:hypothetical protein